MGIATDGAVTPEDFLSVFGCWPHPETWNATVGSTPWKQALRGLFVGDYGGDLRTRRNTIALLTGVRYYDLDRELVARKRRRDDAMEQARPKIRAKVQEHLRTALMGRAEALLPRKSEMERQGEAEAQLRSLILISSLLANNGLAKSSNRAETQRHLFALMDIVLGFRWAEFASRVELLERSTPAVAKMKLEWWQCLPRTAQLTNTIESLKNKKTGDFYETPTAYVVVTNRRKLLVVTNQSAGEKLGIKRVRAVLLDLPTSDSGKGDIETSRGSGKTVFVTPEEVAVLEEAQEIKRVSLDAEILRHLVAIPSRELTLTELGQLRTVLRDESIQSLPARRRDVSDNRLGLREARTILRNKRAKYPPPSPVFQVSVAVSGEMQWYFSIGRPIYPMEPKGSQAKRKLEPDDYQPALVRYETDKYGLVHEVRYPLESARFNSDLLLEFPHSVKTTLMYGHLPAVEKDLIPLSAVWTLDSEDAHGAGTGVLIGASVDHDVRRSRKVKGTPFEGGVLPSAILFCNSVEPLQKLYAVRNHARNSNSNVVMFRSSERPGSKIQFAFVPRVGSDDRGLIRLTLHDAKTGSPVELRASQSALEPCILRQAKGNPTSQVFEAIRKGRAFGLHYVPESPKLLTAFRRDLREKAKILGASELSRRNPRTSVSSSETLGKPNQRVSPLAAMPMVPLAPSRVKLQKSAPSTGRSAATEPGGKPSQNLRGRRTARPRVSREWYGWTPAEGPNDRMYLVYSKDFDSEPFLLRVLHSPERSNSSLKKALCYRLRETRFDAEAMWIPAEENVVDAAILQKLEAGRQGVYPIHLPKRREDSALRIGNGSLVASSLGEFFNQSLKSALAGMSVCTAVDHATPAVRAFFEGNATIAFRGKDGAIRYAFIPHRQLGIGEIVPVKVSDGLVRTFSKSPGDASQEVLWAIQNGLARRVRGGFNVYECGRSPKRAAFEQGQAVPIEEWSLAGLKNVEALLRSAESRASRWGEVLRTDLCRYEGRIGMKSTGKKYALPPAPGPEDVLVRQRTRVRDFGGVFLWEEPDNETMLCSVEPGALKQLASDDSVSTRMYPVSEGYFASSQYIRFPGATSYERNVSLSSLFTATKLRIVRQPQEDPAAPADLRASARLRIGTRARATIASEIFTAVAALSEGRGAESRVHRLAALQQMFLGGTLVTFFADRGAEHRFAFVPSLRSGFTDVLGLKLAAQESSSRSRQTDTLVVATRDALDEAWTAMRQGRCVRVHQLLIQSAEKLYEINELSTVRLDIDFAGASARLHEIYLREERLGFPARRLTWEDLQGPGCSPYSPCEALVQE